MITRKEFNTPIGKIEWYKFTAADGSSAVVSNLGAGVIAINVADKEGNLADVVLGYKNPADWMSDGPCFGKTPGRVANRIAKACFTLDEKEYQLTKVNGNYTLHGGPTGFQNQLWDSEVDGDKVMFTYVSKDGHEGYPGNLTAKVSYEWTDDHVLKIHIESTTDSPTVVNLTNHTYFNLDGEDAGSIMGHKLKLYASKWLPTDKEQIPTGEFAPVTGTPMDFTEGKEIGRDANADFEALRIGKGYDHCWAIDNHEPGKLLPNAELTAEKSGRVLEVWSDQGGLQVYTGNWLSGCPESKTGKDYADYDGVAMECQDFPDSPNKPEFPSIRLNPGEVYERNIEFRFKA